MRIKFAENGCWEWTGPIDKATGYGSVSWPIQSESAHRAVYRLFVGRLHSGWEVDHLCRNRCCVNPEHLELVTPAVNKQRSGSVTGVNYKKTHCIHGHAFDEVNTYYTPKGDRQCRICRAKAERIGRVRRLERAKQLREFERNQTTKEAVEA